MKRNNRRCGDNPWQNRWYKHQKRKPYRYFCENCWALFRTGRFSRFDSMMYDDICPYCGAPGMTFEELAQEYKDLAKEMMKCRKKKKA